jgi:hypothetical protein
MQRVNGHGFFYLGWGIGALAISLQRSGETLSAHAPSALWAAYQLDLLVGASDELIALPLSKSAAQMLAALIRTTFSEEKLAERGQAEAEPHEIANIQTGITNLDALLSAELARCDLYFISKKRAWNMNQLIFSAEDVLSTSVKASLTDECKREIQEAGRCIAFDLPTASGFHIFRAIELVILEYFPVLGVQPPTARNLGQYIQTLRSASVGARITGMLEHLKDHYRNGIIHPEDVLTADEAENLFQFAASAISAMIGDITTRRSVALSNP